MISKRPLEVQPSELNIPFQLETQISCLLQLTNMSDQYVAFKFRTNRPTKYSVRPNAGIVRPRLSCNITVTMEAQTNPPSDMDCGDKLLVQSLNANGTETTKEMIIEMFKKAPVEFVEECKIPILHKPADPPTTALEESAKEASLRSPTVDDQPPSSNLPDTAAEKLASLTLELNNALQQIEILQQELELLRKHKRRLIGFDISNAIAMTLLAMFLGYFFRKFEHVPSC